MADIERAIGFLQQAIFLAVMSLVGIPGFPLVPLQAWRSGIQPWTFPRHSPSTNLCH
jgi:hypothetical protein